MRYAGLGYVATVSLTVRHRRLSKLDIDEH
jgi:hypothetical protein